METPDKNCFIICPLGEEHSATRKRSDKVLNHVLEPVLLKNDYSATRADQIPKVGIITTQIINLILESELVVADLTGSNANVFYELAIRHAIGKPYIQIVNKGEEIPFDISGIRTIEIDLSDLDSVDRARKKMESQIKEFDKGHKADSPISIASTARLLQEDRDLAGEIVDKLSFMGYGEYGGMYDYSDSEKVEKIYRKLQGLNEFSLVSMEDLDNKLDKVIDLLSQNGNSGEQA